MKLAAQLAATFCLGEVLVHARPEDKYWLAVGMLCLVFLLLADIKGG